MHTRRRTRRWIAFGAGIASAASLATAAPALAVTVSVDGTKLVVRSDAEGWKGQISTATNAEGQQVNFLIDGPAQAAGLRGPAPSPRRRR